MQSGKAARFAKKASPRALKSSSPLRSWCRGRGPLLVEHGHVPRQVALELHDEVLDAHELKQDVREEEAWAPPTYQISSNRF
jgi:hypothetical protein